MGNQQKFIFARLALQDGVKILKSMQISKVTFLEKHWFENRHKNENR